MSLIVLLAKGIEEWAKPLHFEKTRILRSLTGRVRGLSGKAANIFDPSSSVGALAPGAGGGLDFGAVFTGEALSPDRQPATRIVRNSPVTIHTANLIWFPMIHLPE